MEIVESPGVTVAIAVVTGILSSYLFWVWLTRGLAPRVKWSTNISVNPQWSGGSPKYRIKIQNVGRRAAVDFSATAMLRVPGVATAHNTKLVNLRTLDVPLPRLDRGKGRVITIKTDGLDSDHVAGLPMPLRDHFNQSPPTTLEEVFDSFPGSELVLYLSAYDEVSGTRRHFRSHPYKKESLTTARFRGNTVEIESGGPV